MEEEKRKEKLISTARDFVIHNIILDEENKILRITDKKNLVLTLNLRNAIYYLFNVSPTSSDDEDDLWEKVQYDAGSDEYCIEILKVLYPKRAITVDFCESDVYIDDEEDVIAIIPVKQ